ncbi:hypothetical protein ACHAWF_007581 [Thalassiosira exigua]
MYCPAAGPPDKIPGAAFPTMTEAFRNFNLVTNSCDSRLCARSPDQRLKRLYDVGQTSQYCGACIDGDIYLFLRYCSDHNVGGDYRNNTRWDVKEAQYVDDEATSDRQSENLRSLLVRQKKKETREATEWLHLKDDEFWVTIWRTDPLNSCELCFVGVGPRC